MNYRQLAIVAIIAFSMLSCSEQDQPVSDKTVGEQTPAVTEAAPVAAVKELPASQGRIISHISVPGYSYLEVENGDQRFWVAGNPVEFQEGDVVAWGQAAVMRNFYSKALDRTFDAILFVSNIFDPASQVPAAGGNRDSQGKVLTVKNAAGYSYVEVAMASGTSVWLAVPETQVNVDDTITWQGGSMMRNFHSKSLDHTFDEILFAGGITVAD